MDESLGGRDIHALPGIHHGDVAVPVFGEVPRIREVVGDE